jgi:hypothetical protein
MGGIIRRVAIVFTLVVAATVLWYRRVDAPRALGERQTVTVGRSGIELRPRAFDPRPGAYAVTLPFADVTGSAGMIQPGARIDVLAPLTAPQGRERRVEKLLENVRVLRTGTVGTMAYRGREISATTLTLEVPTSAQADRLTAAAGAGVFHYLVRRWEEPGVAAVSVRPTGARLPSDAPNR